MKEKNYLVEMDCGIEEIKVLNNALDLFGFVSNLFGRRDNIMICDFLKIKIKDSKTQMIDYSLPPKKVRE